MQTQPTTLDDLCDPVTAVVEPTATLREAARTMLADEVGAVAVADAHGLLGILSERDVLAAVAEGLELDDERVDDHMTVDLVTVAPATPVRAALATTVATGVRHLVVEGNRVISMRRLVEHLLRPGATEDD